MIEEESFQVCFSLPIICRSGINNVFDKVILHYAFGIILV